jgi:hypothetical protein
MDSDVHPSKGKLMERLWDSSAMDAIYQRMFVDLAPGRDDAGSAVAMLEFTAALLIAAKQCGIA